MNKKEIFKSVNATHLAIAVIVVIGALIGISMLNSSSENVVSASGNAQITATPDELIVYLIIETRNTSAQGAKDQNAVISEKVLNELAKIEIEKKDIQTENYNIYPEYSWTGGVQKLKGYVASNYIKVKTTDFSNAGRIVDASVDSGALVSYINFELSNEKMNEYKAAALSSASQDAKKKAEAIVSGLGKRLGRLVSVSSPEYNYMPYPVYRAESSAGDVKQAATNIQPKDIEVSASVNVVYEIK